MQFDVSFERNEIYECGAALLAVLAFPKETSDERSLELYRSLCGKALFLRYYANPNDCTPITVRPQYAFRDRQIIDRDVRYVTKRLGERMVAGRMAIPFLRMGRDGAPPLPREIKRFSVNALAEYVLKDAGQTDSTNVERRFWAKSRPVIHLAAAAAIVGQLLAKTGHPVSLESFLFNRFLIETVVEEAHRLETVIASNSKFPVKFEQLTQFRLA